MQIEIVNKRTAKKIQGAVDVYIGRGGPLGNRFEMGKDGNRDQVCDKYAAEWDKLISSNKRAKAEFNRIISLAKAGKHIRLVCYCAPLRCHGITIRAKVLEAMTSQPGPGQNQQNGQQAKAESKSKSPDTDDVSGQSSTPQSQQSQPISNPRVEAKAEIINSPQPSKLYPGLKLKEISVMVSGKLSRNFNSMAFSYAVTAEAEPNVDFIAAIDSIKGQLMSKIQADHGNAVIIPGKQLPQASIH